MSSLHAVRTFAPGIDGEIAVRATRSDMSLIANRTVRLAGRETVERKREASVFDAPRFPL